MREQEPILCEESANFYGTPTQADNRDRIFNAVLTRLVDRSGYLHCDSVWYWNCGFHFPNLTFDIVYPDGRCTGVWCDLVIDRVVLLGHDHRYVLSVSGGNHMASVPVDQSLPLPAYVFHLQEAVVEVLMSEVDAEGLHWADVVLSIEQDCRMPCTWVANHTEVITTLSGDLDA